MLSICSSAPGNSSGETGRGDGNWNATAVRVYALIRESSSNIFFSLNVSDFESFLALSRAAVTFGSAASHLS